MASTQPTHRVRDDTAPARPAWLRRLGGRLGAVGLVAGAAGVILLVLALVTLARTGIPADDLTAPAVTVGPFGRTPLMAIVELVAGLAFLAAAADRSAGGLGFLGLLTLVFGIVWLIEPGAFQRALGIERATAWLYLGVGVTSGLVALTAPPDDAR